MKRCGCCGEMMSRDRFYVRRASADGLQSWCKACQKRYSREWYSDHPDYRNRLSGARQMEKRQYELFDSPSGDMVTVDISSKNDLLRLFNRLIKDGFIKKVIF